MNCKVSPEEALKQLLQQSEFPFTVVMKNGTMTVEYFSPQEIDEQTPHTGRIVRDHQRTCNALPGWKTNKLQKD